MDAFRKGFTLIELLVVIAIIAILAVVVVLTLNPAQLLAQSRDSGRISDMSTLVEALNVYSVDQASAAAFSLGSSSVVYVSLPDPNATTTAGTNCGTMGLLALPANYTYHCAASSTYRSVNGTGWIPVNFQSISSGAPLSALPIDPVNTSSSRDYYTYMASNGQYEFTAVMESSKYKLGGSNDVVGPDGSALATVYAKGTNLALEPLDYGDPTLAGDWSFDEGTGTIAYDYSGNNATGSWSGAQVGSLGGYYSAGKIGLYAGAFDGSLDAVSVFDRSVPVGASPFTKWVWVYLPNGITSTVYTADIVGWGSVGVGSATNVLRTGGSGNQLVNYFWGNDLSWYSTHIVNGWNNIAVTFDGSTERGYVNGVYEASYTPSTPNVALTTTTIGGKIYAGDNPFTGLIDDVRVYGRAMSAAEIAAMYAGGK
ncbi:MAG TPA: LamG-like jellyroll fold domain-containing protein [Candidatus Paceibacterota bacterium]|nr:LamG-like jellyroll fold domain-containing protein [Candidatus Paceibacterota bacterium]